MRQWWLLVILAIIPLIGWYVFAQQIIRGNPVGNNPVSDWGAVVLWLLLGIGIPLLVWWFSMQTIVTQSALRIDMFALYKRTFSSGEIDQFYVRTYNPVSEYGGWGIKGWWRNNRVYNMSGNRGVQLVLTNGNKVLIGSQRPEELEHAIAEMIGKPASNCGTVRTEESTYSEQ